MTAPIFIGGHSLGGARAGGYAWSRATRGLPVDGVYVCGSPRPGNAILQTATAHIPIWRSIKNEQASPAHQLDHDLVTNVPLDISLINDSYIQQAPFEIINETPLPNDPWGLFRFHHIQLYQAGCRKLPPTGSDAAVELAEAVDAIADLYTDEDPTHWDWAHFVDGEFWGMRTFPNGARLLIARGTSTDYEWAQDFDAVQIDVLNGRVSQGFWSGVGPIEPLLDGVLA